MKNNQTFSILIWANKARGKEGRSLLFARVTASGKRAEISLQREVDIEKWDATAGKLKGNSPTAKNLNQFICEVKTQLFSIVQEIKSKKEILSAEIIKRKFNGEENLRHTLLTAMTLHNDDLKKRIHLDVAKATWVKYNTLIKKVETFLSVHLQKKDIFLDQLEYTFITDFEYYLRAIDKNSSNTTMKYIRMTKKIINEAVRKSWLDKNPFQAFKCNFKWREREVLQGDREKIKWNTSSILTSRNRLTCIF